MLFTHGGTHATNVGVRQGRKLGLTCGYVVVDGSWRTLKTSVSLGGAGAWWGEVLPRLGEGGAGLYDRLIARSPADGVRLPKTRRAAAAMMIPSATQVGAAIEEAQRPLRPYVALCAFAGLRQGEANGLQVGDIDFLRRTCRSRARSKQFRSECSRRASQGGIQAGHLHPRSPDHAAQSTHRVARHQGDEGWLFGTPAARLNRNSSGNLWRRLRARCGLEQFTLHDLRHFYASGLIAAGCDVVTVQRALGHSAPSITLDTYAHLWPSAEDRTRKASAGLMDAAFRRPGETATKD